MKWLINLFRKPAPILEMPEEPSNAAIDAIIERAGRREVFARARENGWSIDNPPPKWVWNVIAHEILYQRSQEQQRSLH